MNDKLSGKPEQVPWDPIDFQDYSGRLYSGEVDPPPPGFIMRCIDAGHNLRVLAERPLELFVNLLVRDAHRRL